MKVIDGKMFKEMVNAGAINLQNNHPEVDALNVFPVPDGDTGTNMSLTFNSGVSEIEKLDTNNLADITKTFSRGLLMGARGNSGVITSQIFRGVSMGLKGQSETDAVGLAKAFENGAKVAYKAVMRPVEGTLLTVIRESSAAMVEYAKEGMEIEDVFEHFVEAANKSLDGTPDLLPVLKEVGVVDSGGAGFLLILNGFLAALKGEKIEASEATKKDTAKKESEPKEEKMYGYCTEYIINLDKKKRVAFSTDLLKNELERLPGKNVNVIQEDDIVKVHLHTKRPGNALNSGQRYGEFIKIKIDKSHDEENSLLNEKINTNKEKKKEVAIISVANGDGIKDTFKELHCDYIVNGGQTMNPSTEDLIGAIRAVNAKNVFVLPNNSNILMTAEQAAKVLGHETNVIVIPSKTIPQGISACIMFNPEASLQDNVNEMDSAIENVKTGEITFAIKDTVIDGIDIKANQYMALCEKEIKGCEPSKIDALKVALDNLVDDESEIITLIYGEDVTEEDVAVIENYVDDSFDAELECIAGKQPVYSFIIGVE